MHKYAERMSEKSVLSLISTLAGASLLLSIADIGMWGYFVILALYAGEHVLQPFMSEIINYRTTEDKRATVLSVSSFLRTLPYVVLAPIIGYLNTHDSLEHFLFVWALLIGVAVIFYLSLRKRDAQISLLKEEVETELRVPEVSTGN
jgi:predicted MFS family arabinose efflux permease